MTTHSLKETAKPFFLGVCLCAFGWGASKAQETTQNSPVTVAIMSWFERLQEGLSASSIGQNYENRNSLVTVAAVRGNKQSLADLDQPAWKKSSISKRVELLKERREFAVAVKSIISGNLKQGQAELDSFQKAHPNSTLIKDVLEAQKKMATLQILSTKTHAKKPSKEESLSKPKTNTDAPASQDAPVNP